MTERVILCAVIEAPTSGSYYMGGDYFATRPTDTPANVLFEGRLLSVIYERAVSFVAWSRDGVASAITEVVYANGDGALDSWIVEGWKGKGIEFYAPAERRSFDAAPQVGAVIIDRIEVVSETRLRHVCTPIIERFAKPVTLVYSQAISNIELRGQTKPLTLGRVRWLDPRANTLSNGSTRGNYDVTDAMYEGIVEVRYRGGLATGEAPSPLPAAGYYYVDHGTSAYGFKWHTLTYRLAAEVRGNIRRGDQIVAYSDFPTGTDVGGSEK